MGLVEQAHLVVRKLHGRHLRVRLQDGHAQRGVERAHGAGALARGHEAPLPHVNLHRGLGQRVFGQGSRVLAVVHDDAEALQGEGGRVQPQMAHEQKPQRAIGHLVGEPGRLPRLDVVEHGLHVHTGRRQVEPEVFRLREQRGLPRQLAHHRAARVAHRRRAHVLVGGGKPRNGARVQATLVGEGRRAGVGMVRRHRHVAELGHVLGHGRELGEAVASHTARVHFQLQIGNDREQIGVAYALADAVHRALHARGAGAHGRERVGHRATGVVVAVDAEGLAREGSAGGRDDLLHFEGQRAAVGLAKIHRVSARLHSRLHAGQGIVAVRFEAVEVVLGIEHHMPAGRLQVRHRLADHAQVLLERRLQRALHLSVPRLPHDSDHRRPARDEVGQPGVVGRRHALLAGGTEGRDLGVLQVHGRHLAEERHVLGVRRREAALDVVDAELVKAPHDGELVGQRERDALALLPIAQGGVVGVDARCGHRCLPGSLVGCHYSARKVIRTFSPSRCS